MRAPKGNQSPLDGLLSVLDTGRRPQTLGGDGRHRCQRVLDPVMQFLENELLQFVCSLPFLRIDTGLSKYRLCVDARLFKQQAKAVNLGAERVRVRRPLLLAPPLLQRVPRRERS